MRTIIAYVLVVPLVQFCLTVGMWLGGFLVVLCLAKAPASLRSKVAGVCGGIVGVALAVAFGYGVFRVVIGPGSFTIGPFLASTLPLLPAILNDVASSRRVKAAQDELLRTIGTSRDEDTAQAFARETVIAPGSGVVGEMLGLAMAAAWFFLQ